MFKKLIDRQCFVQRSASMAPKNIEAVAIPELVIPGEVLMHIKGTTAKRALLEVEILNLRYHFSLHLKCIIN
jgi:hypothetical protein